MRSNESLNVNRETWGKIVQNAQRHASIDGGLCSALCGLANNYYGSNAFDDVWKRLTWLYGKSPTELTTIEEFWKPELKNAVMYVVGKQTLADIEEMTRMRLDCQFSSSMWRRSYRTRDVGYHAAGLIRCVCDWIYWTAYGKSVKEMMYYQHEWVRGYEMYLALELRRSNEEIISLVKEAMYGDNQEILLSRKMILAVVISGNEELIDLLLKLLLAARLQEGLRQQILESADAGSTQTLIKILKLCIDEDMFRYSSAIRALDTWTALGYTDEKASTVKKYAALAYECLVDEKAREQYLKSDNALEVYFAVWAAGCYRVEDTDSLVSELLASDQKYKKVLGWYFVTHTDVTAYQMNMARRYLGERDEEILAWIISNLSVTAKALYSYSYGMKGPKEIQAFPNSVFPESLEKRRELFCQLREIAELIGNKNRTFTGNPFPFSSVTLENARVLSCMMSVAAYDMDEEMIQELMSLRPFMNADQRRALYINFLKPQKKQRHRGYLRDALNDRSVQIKELAVLLLSGCSLMAEDVEALADSLRSKSSSLRKSVLDILKKQDVLTLSPIISKLLCAKEDYQRQAGIELLMELKEENPELLEAQNTYLERMRQEKISTQTEILLDQLMGVEETSEEDYTEENGFGIYDPGVIAVVHEPVKEAEEETEKKEKTGLFSRLFGKSAEKTVSEKVDMYTEREIRQLIPAQKEFEGFLERMNAIFERHADYEYETMNYDGSRTKVLFGNGGSNIRIPAEFGDFHTVRSQRKLEMIPFYQEFVEAAGTYASDVEKMLGICLVMGRWNGEGGMYGLTVMPWFENILRKLPDFQLHSVGYGRYKERYYQMIDIVELFPQIFDAHERYQAALKIYRGFIAFVGAENLGKNYAQKKDDRVQYHYDYRKYPVNHKIIGFWRQMLHKSAISVEDFSEWFMEEYRLEHSIFRVGVFNSLGMENYFRAVELGLIPKDVLSEQLMLGRNAESSIRILTNTSRWQQGRRIYETYPWAKEYVNTIVRRIVEVEEKRGELTTPLTAAARAIERFEGAEYFANLLAALGKENFFRGYAYFSDTTKRAVLSRLLKRCYPTKEDTSEKLKVCLKKTDIKEKRLAEAVMYAPQWAGFAEEILQWPGLKCGVWFFHAHINEAFSAEKETEVALYSPITPQQFNDGAFDKNWFFRAYDQLGEKRFQILYKSAKYITSGSSQHRRSQLYTDAVLGKLDADALKAEIMEKRNQEKLRCYPLIPIPAGQPEEALRRYEFIQKFLKESKQFGAQRRESEKKACNTAMENLAITTGFMDVNRMTWYLESEKMKEIRPLMEPTELDGVKLWLEIDQNGTADLAIEKNGKRIKTLPKTLKKNETVLSLKATIKELKEQKRRAKESLERAMVECTEFGVEELEKISGNPVLAPMLYALVWTDGSRNGFLRRADAASEQVNIVEAECGDEIASDGNGAQKLHDTAGDLMLCDISGQKYRIVGNENASGCVTSITSHVQENKTVINKGLRIAHPHDLMQTGEWADYMHLLYEQKMVQPFKQVFREYYPLTEDERQEKNVSRRYAGHQVQPQKTVALLKSRGWTVDYEEGLQKVYYKENLIVRMYALADWFSPADIEAPTLEIIRFFDRDTGEIVDLEKIPPILFSEAMRDMDLVVSVAHVGGVDPEASHSTMEMRTSIASELTKLLKLSNVSFVGSHAKIHGKLADYSVHMGSGVVHAEAVGMIAILPVHSQARGRIFLPFADEDPKTAEIMSKIILLAEDGKIKDPSILSQIRG